MKSSLSRSLALLASIIVGTVLSWVSIYVFWFAVWTFHSVDVARAADAVGEFILIPGNWIFEWVGGDQSAIFYNPVIFSITNGLAVGIIIYCVWRGLLYLREIRREKQTASNPRNGSAPNGKAIPPQPAVQKVG